MRLPLATSQWVIYLLCLDRPIGSTRHYIGITTPMRLQARMIEHQSGRGSIFTQQAKSLGIGFSLARTWPSEDRLDERLWQDHPKLHQYCPQCLNGKRIQHYRHRPYMRPANPADVGLSFRNGKTGSSG